LEVEAHGALVQEFGKDVTGQRNFPDIRSCPGVREECHSATKFPDTRKAETISLEIRMLVLGG
jgi:hypothetical protein